MNDRPLILQSDFTALLEVNHPAFASARAKLLGFAELVKAPEFVHSYRISALSIWNARAAGLDAERIIATIRALSRFEPPENVLTEIRELCRRFGLFRLEKQEGRLVLSCASPDAAALAFRDEKVGPLLGERLAQGVRAVDIAQRGRLKQALIQLGYPAEDLAGYTTGEPLDVPLRASCGDGEPFALRPYQLAAVQAFHASGTAQGGAGVIVLPCGGGKTIVGIGCMAEAATSTLILTTSITAARQWRAELLDKTNLSPESIGEYTGLDKKIRPVTIATYQILTWRPRGGSGYPHLALFDKRDWGLIIYDEVHLLPAPVFQVTAGLQARRRLGLTATLVREDGREEDVFALIGPRKADLPWKELEKQGWIARATCRELRVPLVSETRSAYFGATGRDRFRVAAENPLKLEALREVLKRHPGKPTLIIGLYVDQVKAIAAQLGVPSLTGATTQKRRDQLFTDFREGRLPVLAVSKVANFAVDLPDAAVAIQISGSYGSRQEEAQRLGRILRPKKGDNQAHFYTLVSRDSVEQDFALKRQLFLCEQGYEYEIENWERSFDASL